MKTAKSSAINKLHSPIASQKIFSDLSLPQIESLAKIAKLKTFQKGAFLTKQKKEADCFYSITKGTILIELDDGANGRIPLQLVEEGDVVGWSWFVGPHYWRFDSRAIAEVKALVFPAKDLKSLMKKDPDLERKLLRKITAALFERLDFTRLQVLRLHRTHYPDATKNQFLEKAIAKVTETINSHLADKIIFQRRHMFIVPAIAFKVRHHLMRVPELDNVTIDIIYMVTKQILDDVQTVLRIYDVSPPLTGDFREEVERSVLATLENYTMN